MDLATLLLAFPGCMKNSPFRALAGTLRAAGASHPESRPVLAGAFWLVVYLALVLAPLFVLLVGPTPPRAGFTWDLSMALGFAGLAMMGVQFLLTARFRRATAPYGIDVIYYFHRYLGVVALAIVLAHPALLWLVHPAIGLLLDPTAAPWHITAGVFSLAALVVLAGTSLWRRPLRIHYDEWRIGHSLLAVAAVALALLHVEGVGYYVASPWKRALWTAIAVSWLAVLGYVRLLRPWRLLRTPYRVVDVVAERGDAWTLAVEPLGHRGFGFQPGQFAWVTLRSSPFAMKEHPFSFSSSPVRSGGRLEFTIKELGDFTRTIKDVPRGAIAYVDGPYGGFSIDRHPAAPGYVLIAGGIGIAPIMSMLRALADREDRRPVLLLYAYRRWERMTFREALEGLQARLDLRVVHVLGEPPEDWRGERGWITRETLERHLPDERARVHYFVCGPEAMRQAMEELLWQLGVPLRRVHSELFDLV